MIRHFVLTRLGLGNFNEEWLSRLVKLFAAVTLPSLVNQSSQAFDYLLVVDAGMRGKPRKHLERLMARYPNFHLVTMDVTRLRAMHMGGHNWIYQACQDFILSRRLLTDPSSYIVTSVIDADDAWRLDYVARVNSIAAERLPALIAAEPDRGSHTRHSAGLGITFENGLVWYLSPNTARPFRFPFSSMSVSVLARFSTGVSAWSSRHMAWPNMLEVLQFEALRIETDHPMWVYVRHGETTRPWDAKTSPPAPNDLQDTFGINLKKTDRWRAAFEPAEGGNMHAGWPAKDQYDRIFQLAALNQQIASIKRGLREETPHLPAAGASLRQLLAEQKAKRKNLIEELRAVGSERFA